MNTDTTPAAESSGCFCVCRLIIVDKETLAASPKALDIYSFGILMWCIVSGSKPYSHLKGVNNFTLLDMIVEGERPELQEHWPQVKTMMIQMIHLTGYERTQINTDASRRMNQQQRDDTICYNSH